MTSLADHRTHWIACLTAHRIERSATSAAHLQEAERAYVFAFRATRCTHVARHALAAISANYAGAWGNGIPKCRRKKL